MRNRDSHCRRFKAALMSCAALGALAAAKASAAAAPMAQWMILCIRLPPVLGIRRDAIRLARTE